MQNILIGMTHCRVVPPEFVPQLTRFDVYNNCSLFLLFLGDCGRTSTASQRSLHGTRNNVH